MAAKTYALVTEKGMLIKPPMAANDHLWKCDIWVESVCIVIKNAMNSVVVGHMHCHHFHTRLLNKAVPDDLLFTPTPFSFPRFVDQALTIPHGTSERVCVLCVMIGEF